MIQRIVRQSSALGHLLYIGLALCIPVQAEKKADQPVRIYVLVGQSNMQGKGAIEGEGSNSLRYTVQNDPEGEYQFLVEKDGSWRERKDVWIQYDSGPGNIRSGGLKPGYGGSGGQVGPELGFGHVIGDAYDGQVLLIKTCWGGKSIGHNFLPPSVGNYPRPMLQSDPGFFYHEILRIVQDVTENIKDYFPDYKDQGFEIAGLGFHQGWNDQYGGLDESYESNLAAFIKDIRSVEHGLGVPGLPVVIATSGMIKSESPVVQGQLAIGDKQKHPEFDGNVSVFDTHKPYGPEKMEFKFYTERSPDSVGYHWNNHARSYVNIGRAMAAEMQKVGTPEHPSRFAAVGTPEGVRLTWQLGSERPGGVKLKRDGKTLDVELAPSRITYTDASALPGKHVYELILKMPSGESALKAIVDTSPLEVKGYRGMEGVVLSWRARGKYDGFRILRNGKTIAEDIAGDVRTYLDKGAPTEGKVRYSIQPTTGSATAAELTVNLGPADPGDALVYEPFDYPAGAGEPQTLIGQGGATGTKGTYTYLADKNLDRAPATLGGGLRFGELPVTGNHGSSHRWSPGCSIELDDSLEKAGLLKDGATLWISYIYYRGQEFEHRQGGGMFTLSTRDLKEGVGLMADNREYRTVVMLDGKPQQRRITSSKPLTPTLVIGRITWGQEGENDSFVPYITGHDLKMPEKHGRASVPFNIDQSKISLLVLQGEGQFDEIRVGPTYESVVGGGTGQ